VEGSTSGSRCAYLQGDGYGAMNQDDGSDARVFLQQFQSRQADATGTSGTSCWLWQGAVTLRENAAPAFPGILALVALCCQGCIVSCVFVQLGRMFHNCCGKLCDRDDDEDDDDNSESDESSLKP